MGKKLARRLAKPAFGSIAGNCITDAFGRGKTKADFGIRRFLIDSTPSDLEHESRRNPAPAKSQQPKETQSDA